MTLRTLQQDKIEVKYLSHPTALSARRQARLALKDGYLLLASHPDAIAQFRERTPPRHNTGEVPVLRISSKELAKVLRQHHSDIVEHFAAQNTHFQTCRRPGTRQGGFDARPSRPYQITHTGGPGQVSMILRIQPPS